MAVQGDALVSNFQLAVKRRFIPDLRKATPTPELLRITEKVFSLQSPEEEDRMRLCAFLAMLYQQDDHP